MPGRAEDVERVGLHTELHSVARVDEHLVRHVELAARVDDQRVHVAPGVESDEVVGRRREGPRLGERACDGASTCRVGHAADRLERPDLRRGVEAAAPRRGRRAGERCHRRVRVTRVAGRGAHLRRVAVGRLGRGDCVVEPGLRRRIGLLCAHAAGGVARVGAREGERRRHENGQREHDGERHDQGDAALVGQPPHQAGKDRPRDRPRSRGPPLQFAHRSHCRSAWRRRRPQKGGFAAMFP